MSENATGVIIRADGGTQIGSGHIVRCLTLAAELARRGMRVRFATRALPGHLAPLISGCGFPVDLLPAEGPEDPAQTRRLLERHAPAWLIVDHYGLDAHWERAQRDAVPAILVIDDLADRAHECDVLLDQNFVGAATAHRYQGLVPVACRVLLGPRYALLHRDYVAMRAALVPRGAARRALVFFGGTDASNETAKALEALRAPQFEHLAVDVVLGANHPAPAQVQSLAGQRPGTTVHRNLPSLAGLMLRADVALGAGGTTTWERLALDLPSAVVTVADNQRAFTRALADAGYVHWIGEAREVTAAHYGEALAELLREPRCAPGLVDGAGAARVADVLFAFRPGAAAARAGASAAGLRVVVLAERAAWINDSVQSLCAALAARGHDTILAHDSVDAPPADVCILLSWGRIVDADFRARYRHTVVAHASDLPRGRGWSPLAWEILHGADRIVVSLIEAAEKVDAGAIHMQEELRFAGHELLPEMQRALGAAIQRLCIAFLDACAAGAPPAREQRGTPSYNARRGAADSALDVNATLAAQFNLLRIVDNQRYPAYFEHRGHRYTLAIRKEES